MNQSSAALTAHQLHHRFGQTIALDHIDLSIPAGGITALLGANGAGKTTLINCALGLCQPSSGTLTVLGGKPATTHAKQRIGVMLQDANLPDLLTVREHIELFRAYYPQPLSLDEVLEQCDLTAFADKRYKHLSGGQKRRCQFALAILGRPQLVFLDEPTTGLDIEARRTLWNTIRGLQNNGTSIILTTHYLEEADALADYIVVIGQGRVLAEGSTQEIRDQVNGAVIRFVSPITTRDIEAMPAVRSVSQNGRFSQVISNNGPQTLAELLGKDPTLGELTVTKPRLEDAFAELTNTQIGDPA